VGSRRASQPHDFDINDVDYGKVSGKYGSVGIGYGRYHRRFHGGLSGNHSRIDRSVRGAHRRSKSGLCRLTGHYECDIARIN
jgi:hypothetical protein